MGHGHPRTSPELKVRNEWRNTFGTAPPSQKTILRHVRALSERGTVADRERPGRPRSMRTEENAEDVAAALTVSPQTSTRRLSSQLGITRTTLQRLLGDLHFHPYRPRLLHGLLPADLDRREQFAIDSQPTDRRA